MASSSNLNPPDDDQVASQTWRRTQTGISESTAAPQRRNDESWVEIASQPSSSSLSSIGDEIVTTGLRIGASSYPPRRRRLQHMHPNRMPASVLPAQQPVQANTSSQEEYDETESEEDKHMSSSNENFVTAAPTLAQQATAFERAMQSDSEDDDNDDDEIATALGRPSNSPSFRPQPNAFSHPPSHLVHRHSTSSARPPRPAFPHQPMSQRSHTRTHRGPNFMSPSYQADNDAALRASLTTLLSCAAAARGLHKKETDLPDSSGFTGVMPSNQPMELRLVPESELMAQPAPSSSGPSPPSSASSKQRDEPTITGPAANTEKSRRHSAPQQPRSPRATKKKRTTASSPDAAATEAAAFAISPTFMTWVVSAGVLVLVSVVGFGAGYVIGREVGRQEGGALVSAGMPAGSAANASTSCGRELARSASGGTLRRFRWGAVGRGVTA